MYICICISYLLRPVVASAGVGVGVGVGSGRWYDVYTARISHSTSHGQDQKPRVTYREPRPRTKDRELRAKNGQGNERMNE